MNTLTSQLLLWFLYLVFGIIGILIVVKVTDFPFKKMSSRGERHNSTFGIYLFFSLLCLALFFSQMPSLINNAQGLIKTGASSGVWGETIKLIFIFSGLSLLFWGICYYASLKSVLLVKKGANLFLEITADQKFLVFFYGGINLLLSYLLKDPFGEVCKYFLPETGIPFYR